MNFNHLLHLWTFKTPTLFAYKLYIKKIILIYNYGYRKIEIIY